MISPLQTAADPFIGSLAPGRPGGGLEMDAADSFARVLEHAAAGDDRQKLREAAGQLVSSGFIVPVLASLRESQFLEAPFAPNAAEKRFAPLLDQQIADRIVSAANFPLVDVIVDRLTGAPS